MVSAIVLSPTDRASQEAVVGWAQRVVVTCAWAPRDAAFQHCLEYLSSEHPDSELEGSARSVGQFEGILLEAALYVAYVPVDLDGQVKIVVDVPPDVYELVRLVVHLARCLYAECGDGLRHPFRTKHMILLLASDTVSPNAAHTTTIKPVIFLRCSGNCETTPASSA